MVNRVIAILLACCILFVNTGWALTAHYCMGERVGVNLRHAGLLKEDGHECYKCGMKKAASDNGCCHDEEVVIKSSQDALSILFFIQLTVQVADLPIANLGIPHNYTRLYVNEQSDLFQPHGPPGYSSLPLFLSNCAFLI